MTADTFPRLGAPAHLTAQDDLLHPPADPSIPMWGDTFWISTIDPAAGIVGINHFQLTNRGYGRFQVHYWIDGVRQSYGWRVPVELDPELTRWSGGGLTYEVLEPFEHLRLTLDTPRFGYELDFRATSPAFEYDDVPGGSPLNGLAPVAKHHGGHYEQAMRCTGTFELRDGPAAGTTRTIDTLSHRDHTWSDRFGNTVPWEVPPRDDVALHFWLVLQFPERNLNATGFFDLSKLGLGDLRPRGGAELTPAGNRPIVDCDPVPGYDGDAAKLHEGGPTRWWLRFADGEECHVRVTRLHAQAKLWKRGENDLENALDDYEDIVELEIEETGERGHGVVEYSLLPRERWVV